MFTKSDLPTDACRKYVLLQKMSTSAIRMIRQIIPRFLRTIVKHRTETINHDININRLRKACQAARSLQFSAPQLCIASTTPQSLGETPFTTRAMPIPQQIQATKETYDRQMGPPPGNHSSTVPWSTIPPDPRELKCNQTDTSQKHIC